MAVLNGPIVLTGAVGIKPMLKYMLSTDSMATITTAGYLNENLTNLGSVTENDMLLIRYDFVPETNAGTNAFFTVSISDGIITLAEDVSEGNVQLPVAVNHIAVFADTAGKIKQTQDGNNTTIETYGNIWIRSGSAGQGILSMHAPDSVANTGGDFAFQPALNTADVTYFVSHEPLAAGQIITMPNPGTGFGYSLIAPWNNVTAPFTSGNVPTASGTKGLMLDSGVASNKILTSSFASPDVSANLVTFDTVVTAADLAAGASKILFASSGSKQYKIVAMWISTGTNFSGGGGDRGFEITDGTTAYSIIPSTSFTTLVNKNWSNDADFPFPLTAPVRTSTVAGANLVIKYTGGTADYAAGSTTVSGLLQRVA